MPWVSLKFNVRPLDLRQPDPKAVEKLWIDLANIHSACALLTILVPSITSIDHDHSYSRKHFAELNTNNNNNNIDVKIKGSSSLESDIETRSPITSEDMLKVELEHLQFILSEWKMTEQHRKKLSDNPLWYEVRFKKLTGSMSSQGLAQKTWIPYLLQRILYPKSFPFVPATIQWGTDHESTAHTVYSKFMYASNHPTLTQLRPNLQPS